MKLNIANPATGAQKLIELEDEQKMRIFYDKKISTEVDADPLGEEWKGYRLKITGGNDKQGFPMMQGVLVNHRVRLLLDLNSKCYRPRRPGERVRKSVRGAITGPDLSVIALVVTKKGEKEIPGLTDVNIPVRLGPKRASKIRKLYSLTKEDDVRKFVIRRVNPKKPKRQGKAPRIQRLLTPRVQQRTRRTLALRKRVHEKARSEAAAYAKLLTQRRKEAKNKRLSSKRRSSVKRDSQKGATAPVVGGVAPAEKPHAVQAAQAQKGTAPSVKAQKQQGPKGARGTKGAAGAAGAAKKPPRDQPKRAGPQSETKTTKGGGGGERGGAVKRAK
eukprot:TRINITY_DN7667_c0_g1_i1.p1 TRINITY_DN7667_c0_g1~~TRINITY_DN7667_c0_g1_i1.p1  ORF type:complete len:331 (-),score=120.15 TRINITY_DN7667_c0_g1_i1:65-1057(-)